MERSSLERSGGELLPLARPGQTPATTSPIRTADPGASSASSRTASPSTPSPSGEPRAVMVQTPPLQPQLACRRRHARAVEDDVIAGTAPTETTDRRTGSFAPARAPDLTRRVARTVSGPGSVMAACSGRGNRSRSHSTVRPGVGTPGGAKTIRRRPCRARITRIPRAAGRHAAAGPAAGTGRGRPSIPDGIRSRAARRGGRP